MTTDARPRADAAPDQEQAVSRRTVLSGAGLLTLASLAGCGRDQPQGPAPGTVLAATADVPVGGGVVLAEHRIVVTQPAPGAFAAFSAVCTHQACLVGEVAEGVVSCPCHGSRFAVADGAVVRGPARQPLRRVPVVVEGSDLRLA